ncbi:MAG: hypothetical protein AAFR21_06980 [Pseudomonadota bacterium]
MGKNANDGRPSTLPLDALAEDLFGLNFRALRTVKVLWFSPKTYFDSAKTIDWADNFTPSIRLWLSFFALFSALKFWWLGGNDGMITAFADGFENAGLILPEGTSYRDIGRDTVLWVFGLIPILQIVIMVVLSLIWPFWGEHTTAALRQRYFFSIIVPSASLMPVFMTLMMLVPSNHLTGYGIAIAIVAFSVDFQTGLRGGFSTVSGFSKVWRAGLLAFVVVVLNVSTSIAAQIAGIIVTSQTYGVVPQG